MVSSLGLNSVYNYYNSSNLIDRAVRPLQQNSIFQPAATATNPISTAQSKNLIDQYLEATGVYNSPMFKSNNVISQPSGIGNYNNYTETDIYGRELVAVKYSQSGSAISQNLKTTSPDGTTVEKVTTNDNGKNSFNMVIKDKSGRVLMEKNKTQEKITDDMSRTTVNGEVYTVSGLTSDVLTIEHDGKTTTLDLRKMTDEKVEKMSVGKNEEETFENRPEKISDAEREILYSKIKSMGGDDLVRLSESIDEIAFLDAPDGSQESFYNDRALIYTKDIGSLVTLHELGHGVNHKNSDDNLISDNSHITNIRDYEIRNFKANKTNSRKDELFDIKFTDEQNLMNTGMTNSEAKARLKDEIFAEAYAVTNSTSIMNFDDNVNNRTLSLIKYCPRTISQVETYSC